MTDRDEGDPWEGCEVQSSERCPAIVFVSREKAPDQQVPVELTDCGAWMSHRDPLAPAQCSACSTNSPSSRPSGVAVPLHQAMAERRDGWTDLSMGTTP
jgi:hypothetical protein